MRANRIARTRALLLALALAASPGFQCDDRAVADVERVPSRALPPPGEGPLLGLLRGPATEGSQERKSSFLLLDANREALRWRLALVDSAVQSLDLQYYLWKGDAAGDLLARRVLAAADRGVRVRLLVDDFLITGDDLDLAVFTAHPNVELRTFNPWQARGGRHVRRSFEWLARGELNHRMHNKLLVADGVAAIVGGRNVGDEYFGVNPRRNFRDLDVVVVGPVVADLGEAFDSYWNDEWAIPADALAAELAPDDYEAVRDRLAPSAEERSRLSSFSLEPSDWSDLFKESAERFVLASSVAVADDPASLRDPAAQPVQVLDSIGDLVAGAQRELAVVSAYFVPSEAVLERLESLEDERVRVRVLTNSLGSTNHPIVNSQYKRHRRALLDAGVELHEMRHEPRDTEAMDTPPIAAAWQVLHAKALLVDRERMYIGALNVTPRGFFVNAENGLLIEGAELVGQIAARLDRDFAHPNAWQVIRDDQGRMRWVSGEETLDRQPARSAWARFQDLLFGLFSIEAQI